MPKTTLIDCCIKKYAYPGSITNISGIKDIRGGTVTILIGGIDEGKVWYK